MPLRFPLVIWASGERAHLISSVTMTKENQDWLRCGFVLSSGTKEKHRIGHEYGNNLLDENNPEFPEGIYYHEYKRNHVIPLNPTDPSDPVVLIWNKFDGTMINPKGELFMLSDMVTNMDLLEKENKQLHATINDLNNRLMAISAGLALYKKRYGAVISPELEEIGKLIAGFQKFTKGGGGGVA